MKNTEDMFAGCVASSSAAMPINPISRTSDTGKKGEQGLNPVTDTQTRFAGRITLNKLAGL